MRYDLLTPKGYFIDPRYNGMILGNTTLTRLWFEKCKKDDPIENPPSDAKGLTAERERLYVR